MADITPSDTNNYNAPVPPSGDLLRKMGIDDFVVEVATGNILQPTLTTEQQNTFEALKVSEWPKMRLRARRDKLLEQCDWMANSDVTMSDAWKTYRQALRDLPANSPSASINTVTGKLENVTWPTKPS
jgi:hypothetical protein|tara:strand:- start:55 stop:438 length:384 start_codon:yes stop_codon:yes gene_type:complete